MLNPPTTRLSIDRGQGRFWGDPRDRALAPGGCQNGVGFISHYKHEHKHSGIDLRTPASVHFGTAGEVRDQRAVTLAEAYARHPERFGRRPRQPKLPQAARIDDPAKRIEADSGLGPHKDIA